VIPSVAARRLSTLAILAMCCPLLAACTLPYEQLSLPGPVTGAAGSNGTSHGVSKNGVPLSGSASSSTHQSRSFPGTGDFASQNVQKTSATSTGSDPDAGSTAGGGGGTTSQVTKDGITLNLVGASVSEVAKTVLGDVLGVNYTVSDKVKATITLRTAHPVEKAGLLSIFEAVLRAEGAAIVVEGDLYKIVPSADVAAGGGAPLRGRKGTAGVATEVVPLKYVSAAEMERILRSAAPQAGVLRVDPSRNLLMLSGTQTELGSMHELVRVFDVDWMRGMSFGIYPVETADVDAIAQELDTIFANDTKDSPTKGIVRFVPNKRLKSVLVISSRPEYLKKAETWLSRIDLASKATEKQVNVYNVQHRPASELAQLLQKVYQARGGSGGTASSTASRSSGGAAASVDQSGQGSSPSVTTGAAAAASSSGGSGSGLASAVSGGSTVGTPAQAANETSKPADSPASGDALTTGSIEAPRTAAGGGLPPDDRSAGISVVADEAKNALIITATPAEFKRVKQVLSRIDIEANQILIEATIAEVTLNDNVKFGVRWFLGGSGSNAKLNSALSPNPLAALPIPGAPALAAGFQYALNIQNLQVVLNALSSVTDVNIVSSPSLMVMENKRATLQVGDDVPIITQQATAVQGAGSPIVNSVSYRSTGIILGITPRLSDDGRVFLEIEQEVSNVASNSVATGPTISQRRVKTTVTVNGGETIILAGLMKDDTTRDRDQVPLLGDVPLFGNAFKTKDDTIKRTELLISITPQIIRDRQQIDDVTAEYRDNLNFSTRPQRRAPPDHRETLDRLIR
jgi:general secretion pathway protein D